MFFQKPLLHYIVETVLFLIIILLLSTCKKEDAAESTAHVTPVTTFSGQNIVAIDGPEFGSGASANSDLYKQVSISWQGNKYADLKVTKAYIQQAETLSVFRFSYVIPVDNISTNHAYCGVGSTGLSFLNSDFSKIYTDALNSTAYSSIGLANSTDWEHCIKPESTGYIVGDAESLALSPYSKIKYIELGLTYKADSVVSSGAKVEASSYAINNGWMEVSIKNNGYDTAYIWPYTSIVLILDANEVPMQWRYLNVNLDIPTEIMSTVGSTDPLPVLLSQAAFSGLSSKAKFFLTFSTSPIYPF